MSQNQSSEPSGNPPIPMGRKTPMPSVGRVYHYTDIKGKIRAATCVFVLEDGQDVRPVLRVMVPAAPLLPAMPQVTATTPPPTFPCGQQDYEVYGAHYNPDESAVNTWRPVA